MIIVYSVIDKQHIHVYTEKDVKHIEIEISYYTYSYTTHYLCNAYVF